MKLTAAYEMKRLKEADATSGLSHQDIRARLSDALTDSLSGGRYGWIRDIFGDDTAGEVVYCCGDDLLKAPYEITDVGGSQVASIDTDAAVAVAQRTIYEEEPDEADNYAAMEEAFKAEKLYDKLPLYERFIGKAERDSADSSDFAGKGKSFPILKPGDVMAAVRSMGRAGAANLKPTGIKARIIAIAKRKGWTKYLPKAWQAGGDDSSSADTSESTSTRTLGLLALTESAAMLETIVLTEAAAVRTIPIKIISPGAGSSAFYPKEVLQRDGPKVFKAGTHVYVNHPTAAEEAARPEGDVKNLGGVLAADAVWHESFMHKGEDRGAGLYSEVKPFSDHANLFNEKGDFLGMSIRASGKAESRQMKNGLPILTELTSAESVDVVTRAGAGGMILTESATGATTLQEAETMTAEEITKLIEASTKPLHAQLLRDASERKAVELLEGVALPTKAKLRVIETVLKAGVPMNADGTRDETKFREAVAAEAKSIGELLTEASGGGRVTGFGAAPVVSIDPKEAKRERKALKEARKQDEDVLLELTGDKEVAKLAARGREDAA
jgi:hypothetical protein